MAKEMGALHGWKAKLWSGRYHSMPVGDSEAAQIERNGYILLNGCKENLVASPNDWPGVTSVPSLCRGEWEIPATWFNRTKEYGPRVRGKRQLYPESERCGSARCRFSKSSRRSNSSSSISMRCGRSRKRRRHATARRVRRPSGFRRSCGWIRTRRRMEFIPSHGVRFYAATLEEYFEMRDTLAAQTAAYREASARLRQGEENVRFPEGTFPAAARSSTRTRERRPAPRPSSRATEAHPPLPPRAVLFGVVDRRRCAPTAKIVPKGTYRVR